MRTILPNSIVQNTLFSLCEQSRLPACHLRAHNSQSKDKAIGILHSYFGNIDSHASDGDDLDVRRRHQQGNSSRAKASCSFNKGREWRCGHKKPRNDRVEIWFLQEPFTVCDSSTHNSTERDRHTSTRPESSLDPCSCHWTVRIRSSSMAPRVNRSIDRRLFSCSRP